MLTFFLTIISLFNTDLATFSVTDIDGNVYKTMMIGAYEWMAENLKTTTYNDGTKIPNVIDSTDWSNLNSGAYCWYNNDKKNAEIYGALYNWYAVNTGRLCPRGWHVPSDEEWKTMEIFVDTRYGNEDTIWDTTGLRGFDVALSLKASSGWERNGNGLDRYGFSALPGGERLSSNGRFFIMGYNGFWWTSDEYTSIEGKALYRGLLYPYDQMMRYFHDKIFGFSVRCIRDN